nr:hypothetical protein CFP56_14277 [Quercus suber]
MIGCTRFGEHGASGSAESVPALSGVVDCEVFGKFFKSLSISVICTLKRFKFAKISILVGECSVTDSGFEGIAISVEVGFGTDASVPAAVSEACSVVGDGF